LSVADFYDALAPWYHLVYRDWQGAIARQGEALSALIVNEWGSGVRRVIDASVGVGTQALGLAAKGYGLIGSDVALGAVHRAVDEGRRRGLPLPCLVADMRALPFDDQIADAVIACDNSLPHLLSRDQIRLALAEFIRCLRGGGGCVISLRDYGTPPADGTVEIEEYGERLWRNRLGGLRQVWRWRGSLYDMTFELIASDGSGEVVVSTPQTTYFAVAPAVVAELMQEVGFERVRRVDGGLFQPVLVGTREGRRRSPTRRRR
jgi:SAM-dependent methyltransferase